MLKPLPTIGLDYAFIAELLTEPVAANPTYATPIRLRGSVELSAKPNAPVSNFYADDGPYVQTAEMGDQELAMVLSNLDPETYALMVGATYNSSNGQIIETMDDVPLEFALGFRSQLSDKTYEYNWYYVGIISKPERKYNTKGEAVTYNTLPVTFKPRPANYALGKYKSFRNYFLSGDSNFPVGLTDELLINLVTGWASDPNYIPVAPGTAVSDFAVATGSGAAGTLAATWTAATDATLVKIQVYDPVTETWNDVSTTAVIGVGDASAELTGLVASNTYNCRLVVVSGTNNGISNENSAVAHA